MGPKAWQRFVAPQLVSALPGEWLADGNVLKRRPTSHLTWYLVRSITKGNYSFNAIIQPQYVVSRTMNGSLALNLGHGLPDRSYFTETDVDDVAVAEIRALLAKHAVPFFEQYGRDLRSYLPLPERAAKRSPTGRGYWWSEAYRAGAYSLLGRWRPARRSWANCSEALAAFPGDFELDLRALAAFGAEATDKDSQDRVVDQLLANERTMSEIWKV